MEPTGNIDDWVECSRCGGRFTVRQLIVSATGCYRDLRVVRSATSCCQSAEELWLGNGLASRGYIYAAGQAHFADMEHYDAPGLVVLYDPEIVRIELGQFQKTIRRDR